MQVTPAKATFRFCWVLIVTSGLRTTMSEAKSFRGKSLTAASIDLPPIHLPPDITVRSLDVVVRAGQGQNIALARLTVVAPTPGRSFSLYRPGFPSLAYRNACPVCGLVCGLGTKAAFCADYSVLVSYAEFSRV